MAIFDSTRHKQICQCYECVCVCVCNHAPFMNFRFGLTFLDLNFHYIYLFQSFFALFYHATSKFPMKNFNTFFTNSLADYTSFSSSSFFFSGYWCCCLLRCTNLVEIFHHGDFFCCVNQCLGYI